MGQGRAGHICLFGDFRLDTRRRKLSSRSDGQVTPLTAKALDTLICLVERAGELLDRTALEAAIWPGLHVGENSLGQNIAAVRRALGEGYIVTQPGRGYRFVCDVTIEDHPPTPSARVLAVLPFKPISGPAADASLELGMADAMIVRLGALKGIAVSPLSSVRRFGAEDQDPMEAGRALGANTVLDGSVQREGERLRISARLIDTASGAQLWAGHFDETFTSVLAIQDTIAERVAEAVLDTIAASERAALRRHPTEDADAYQSYVWGWIALTRPNSNNLAQAVQHLQQAIHRDPKFALAHGLLARAYGLQTLYGPLPAAAAYDACREAALLALAIDPDQSDAHLELSSVYSGFDRDWERASFSIGRALEVDPSSASAHLMNAFWQLQRGKRNEALAAALCSQALEPLAPTSNLIVGIVLFFSRRYEEAARQMELTLETAPGFDVARTFLGRALLRLGQIDRAIEEFEKRAGWLSTSAADLPVAWIMLGRRKDAEAALEEILQRNEVRGLPAFDIAAIYAALGQNGSALDWLENAFDRRLAPIETTAHEPMFDSLRDEPRFQRLIDRLTPP